MRMTLLDMTQNILSAIDGDDVNSISDTVQSLQVARTIVETYYELYAGLDEPSRYGLIELDSLADPAQMTTMKLPQNCKSVKWIRYNGNEVLYQDPEDFIIDGLQGGDYQLDKIRIWTDRDPTRWTTFDNEHIVFNAINNDVDSVLQASKTVCWGQFVPVFDFVDNAYPPMLSPDDYPGLLAEAKSTCFINQTQAASSKEEQRSRRQRVRRQNDKWRADQRKPFERTPDYGRRRRGG